MILHAGFSGMWAFCFLVMFYLSKDLPATGMHVVGKVIGCHGAEGINVGTKTYGAWVRPDDRFVLEIISQSQAIMATSQNAAT